MPPKRSARASTRAGSTPARKRQSTREPSSETGLGGPAVMGSNTPNPSKYSTTYGSPATIMPSRRPGTYGSNLAGAFGSVLEKVRQDNEEDEQARRDRDADEARRARQESSPIVEEPTLPVNSDVELPRNDGGQQSSDASEPQIDSDSPAAPTNEAAGSTPFPGRRQTRASQRAGSAQPADTPASRSGPVTRLRSEPPPSDAPTMKSYVEESSVFNRAAVNTPLALSGATTSQQTIHQSKEDSVEPTPSRRSTRNTTKSATSSAQSTPAPVPRRKLIDRIVERSNTLSAKIPEEPEKEVEAEASSRASTSSSQARSAKGKEPMRPPPVPAFRAGPLKAADLGRVADSSNSTSSEEEEEEEEEDEDDINGKDPITTIMTSAASRRRSGLNISPFMAAQGSARLPTRVSRATTEDEVDRAEKHQERITKYADTRYEDIQRQIQQTRDMWNSAEASTDRLRRTVRDEQNPSPSPDPEEEPTTATRFLNIGKSSLQSFLRWLGGLALLFIVTRLVVFYTMPPQLYAGVRIDSYKPDWTLNPFHNLASMLPWSVLHPLGCLSNEEYNAWGTNTLQQYHLTQDNKRRLNAQHEQIEKLAKFMPKVVHMELDKDGKPKIPQDFWHALRGLIQEDSMILTLNKLKDGSADIAENHWTAIKHRIQQENSIISGGAQNSNTTALSVVDVEHIADRTFSRSWETWVKQNEGDLENRLGAGVEQRVLARMDEALKERLRERATNDVEVPRAEFMQILRAEFAKHDAEIKAQVYEIEERLNDAVSIARQAADSPHPPAGLSRDQAKTLVEESIRKILGDAQLEAMAKSKISTHYHDELSTQLNVFDMGNHATVDRTRTSRTYQLPTKLKDESWWQRQKGPAIPLDAYAALMPWYSPGDCWCTAMAIKDKSAPADLAIVTGRRLVPQNLVVEHIDAGATVDPDATPKVIEVWAHIDEANRRKTLEGWMFNIYPDTKKDHPLLVDQFIKVGEFIYDRSLGKGNVQVFQMSRELLRMDAQTDQVVIRAVSNYGADHTCFYRLRLYGEIIEPGKEKARQHTWED